VDRDLVVAVIDEEPQQRAAHRERVAGGAALNDLSSGRTPEGPGRQDVVSLPRSPVVRDAVVAHADGIGSGRVIEDVAGAPSSEERVSARPADEPIVAEAAVHRIVPGAAE